MKKSLQGSFGEKKSLSDLLNYLSPHDARVLVLCKWKHKKHKVSYMSEEKQH